jgi:hypothetical protein
MQDEARYNDWLANGNHLQDKAALTSSLLILLVSVSQTWPNWNTVPAVVGVVVVATSLMLALFAHAAFRQWRMVLFSLM